MHDYERIIAMARSQIGVREGYSNGHWNNDQKYSKELPGFAWSNRQAWCDTFVAWVFWKCALLNILKPPSAGVWTSYQGWLKAGRFTEYPTLGAQVIFGRNVHTGIVVAYDANYIWTVEGNTNDTGSAEGNGVYERRRNRRDSQITGYGVPQFPDGVIVSADPHWNTAGGAVPVPAPAGAHRYTVQRGDTFAKIAAAAGITLAALVLANPGVANPNKIVPGQTVNVPGNSGPAVPGPSSNLPSQPGTVPGAGTPAGGSPSAGNPNAGTPSTGSGGSGGTITGTTASGARLTIGMRNGSVTAVQSCLARRGYNQPVTGYYGTVTAGNVNRFILANPRLAPADGVAGPQTQAAICGYSTKGVNAAPASTGLTVGARSARVTAYQKAVRAYLGRSASRYNPSGATGYYGSETAAMTRAVYLDLGRKHPRQGWTVGNLGTPGPGLLKVLGY